MMTWHHHLKMRFLIFLLLLISLNYIIGSLVTFCERCKKWMNEQRFRIVRARVFWSAVRGQSVRDTPFASQLKCNVCFVCLCNNNDGDDNDESICAWVDRVESFKSFSVGVRLRLFVQLLWWFQVVGRRFRHHGRWLCAVGQFGLLNVSIVIVVDLTDLRVECSGRGAIDIVPPVANGETLVENSTVRTKKRELGPQGTDVVHLSNTSNGQNLMGKSAQHNKWNTRMDDLTRRPSRPPSQLSLEAGSVDDDFSINTSSVNQSIEGRITLRYTYSKSSLFCLQSACLDWCLGRS